MQLKVTKKSETRQYIDLFWRYLCTSLLLRRFYHTTEAGSLGSSSTKCNRSTSINWFSPRDWTKWNNFDSSQSVVVDLWSLCLTDADLDQPPRVLDPHHPRIGFISLVKCVSVPVLYSSWVRSNYLSVTSSLVVGEACNVCKDYSSQILRNSISTKEKSLSKKKSNYVSPYRLRLHLSSVDRCCCCASWW